MEREAGSLDQYQIILVKGSIALLENEMTTNTHGFNGACLLEIELPKESEIYSDGTSGPPGSWENDDVMSKSSSPKKLSRNARRWILH